MVTPLLIHLSQEVQKAAIAAQEESPVDFVQPSTPSDFRNKMSASLQMPFTLQSCVSAEYPLKPAPCIFHLHFM